MECKRKTRIVTQDHSLLYSSLFVFYIKKSVTYHIEMEYFHVHDVYDSIAQEFDKTRYAQWKCVRDFLDKLPSYSMVADIGCGNGKYFNYRKDINMIGIDMCGNLLEIAHIKSDALKANALALPLTTGKFDAVICVAMLHHLSSKEKRDQVVQEIKRILRSDGSAFITVWAAEQPIRESWIKLGNNDYYIPWKNKTKRFYHLFTQQEAKEISDDVYYECNNWCITITKENDIIET